MPAEKKPPRRTAERIVEVSLELFNRFGEPNVSTTLISAEMGISPGNLYYHFPAKEDLVNALVDRYRARMAEILPAAAAVRDVEDAWLLLHLWLEANGQYRFVLRDLDDLLSRNRHLETQVGALLRDADRALRAMLEGLAREGALQLPSGEAAPLATSMGVLLTYWLSHAYVRDPRHALEPSHAAATLAGGVQQALHLLRPYLQPAQREHLDRLAAAGHGQAPGR